MQEQNNVPFFIFLAIIATGLLIAIGGFDDAHVRNLENPQKLSTFNTLLKF